LRFLRNIIKLRRKLKMKKVLIVEDDFYVRNLYKMAFEKNGYLATEAENGEEALEKIKEEKFDLVTLDLMLPGISGIEVLEKIKGIIDAPVYILTNVGDDTILQEAIRKGARAYFLKVDFTPNQLVKAIEEKETTN